MGVFSKMVLAAVSAAVLVSSASDYEYAEWGAVHRRLADNDTNTTDDNATTTEAPTTTTVDANATTTTEDANATTTTVDANVTTTTVDANVTTTTVDANATTTTSSDPNATTTTTVDANATTTVSATTVSTEVQNTTVEATTVAATEVQNTTTEAASTVVCQGLDCAGTTVANEEPGETTVAPGNTTTSPNTTSPGEPMETFKREVSVPVTVGFNCTGVSGDCGQYLADSLLNTPAAVTKLVDQCKVIFQLTTEVCTVKSITGTVATARARVLRAAHRSLTVSDVELDVQYEVTVTEAQDTALQTKASTVDTTALSTFAGEVKTALETDANLGDAVGTVVAEAPVVGASDKPVPAATTSAAADKGGLFGMSLLALLASSATLAMM